MPGRSSSARRRSSCSRGPAIRTRKGCSRRFPIRRAKHGRSSIRFPGCRPTSRICRPGCPFAPRCDARRGDLPRDVSAVRRADARPSFTLPFRPRGLWRVHAGLTIADLKVHFDLGAVSQRRRSRCKAVDGVSLDILPGRDARARRRIRLRQDDARPGGAAAGRADERARDVPRRRHLRSCPARSCAARGGTCR